MSEPKRITAGDAVGWERQDSYANGVNTFLYRLVGPKGSEPIDITPAAADGVLTVEETSTENWRAGEYKWFLFRTVGAERSLVDSGYLVIDADPTKVSEIDSRSHAERMLELIDQRLEGRINSDHERYTIDGRSLDRIPVETLVVMRKRYAWAAHDQLVARGLRKPQRKIRFR